MTTRSDLLIALGVLLLMPSLACTQEVAPQEVHGYLSGRITVSAVVDSSGDYSGIEIIVTDGVQDGPDTLGYAVTAMDGSFETPIVAKERGVYPLIMKRRGAVLSVSEYVVVEGDSATLRAELPLGQRLPNIRSAENSAWLAFKNADAQHNQRVLELLQQGGASQEALKRTIELNSEVLWSVRSSFPATLAASVASAKAVIMLEGWNDSLLVSRAEELDPEQAGYLEGVKAAGRAHARRDGLDAGIAFLRSKRDQLSDPEMKAALQREVAQAYIDGRNAADALAAIDSLKDTDNGDDWKEWADRARYEIENLFPGRPAPRFSLATRDGGHVDLDSLLGRPIVIEFWSPRDREYAQRLSTLASLLANDSSGVRWLSAGLESDEDLYDAFFEGRDVPGIQIHDANEKMDALVVKYNVETVPTRYLIDSEGHIVEKYVGPSLADLVEDLQGLTSDSE